MTERPNNEEEMEIFVENPQEDGREPWEIEFERARDGILNGSITLDPEGRVLLIVESKDAWRTFPIDKDQVAAIYLEDYIYLMLGEKIWSDDLTELIDRKQFIKNNRKKRE